MNLDERGRRAETEEAWDYIFVPPPLLQKRNANTLFAPSKTLESNNPISTYQATNMYG